MNEIRYEQGDWFAVVHDNTIVMLAPSTMPAILEQVWLAVCAGDGIDRLLALLTSGHASSLPSFALVELRDRRVRAYLRGEAGLEVAGGVLEPASGAAEFPLGGASGESGRTRFASDVDMPWLGVTIRDVTEVWLGVQGGDAAESSGPVLPVLAGVVRAHQIGVGLEPATDPEHDDGSAHLLNVAPVPVSGAPADPGDAQTTDQTERGESFDPRDTSDPCESAEQEEPAPVDVADVADATDVADVADVVLTGGDAADLATESKGVDPVFANSDEESEELFGETIVDPTAIARLRATLTQDTPQPPAPLAPATQPVTPPPAPPTQPAPPTAPPAPSAARPAAPPVPPPPPARAMQASSLIVNDADHDGMTIMSSDLVEIRAQLPNWTRDEVPGPFRVPDEVAPPKLLLSSGLVVTLDRTVLIGRAPVVSRVSNRDLPRLVTVDSPNQDISRTHVQVQVEGHRVFVTDLNSTNGVTLSLRGRTPARIRAGVATDVLPDATVDIGDGVTFRVVRP